MASEFYDGYLLASRPRFDFNAWIPYVLVSWRERGELQFQKFPEVQRLSFPTESEALSFGFLTAHTWVDSSRIKVTNANGRIQFPEGRVYRV